MRHKYSVLEVVQSLHGHATGTGNALQHPDHQEYIEWLTWRISSGWKSPESRYDYLVRRLALEALALNREES